MRAGGRLGRSSVLLSWVFLSSLAVTAPPGPPPSTGPAPGQAAPPQVFEANRGQTDARAAFVSRADGLLFRLDPAGIDIDLGLAGDAEGSGHTRLVFPGSSPDAAIAGLEPLAGTVSYFTGADPAGWVREVPTFAAVRYRGVYAGVDLTVRGDHRRLTLVFSLPGGADPDVIGVSLESGPAAEALRLHRSGGKREVRYTLDRVPGPSGTALPSADAGRAGIPDEIARVVVDRDGNTFVAGRSLGAGAAGLGRGAIDPAGGAEAFVARVDRDGQGPAWVAWFGGTGRDRPTGLAVAGDGAVVVAGRTESPDFPLARELAQHLSGPSDAFVARLSADGGALLASTYLGGGGEDEARDVALDADDNAWIAGAGSGAALLTVLSPEGDRLVRRAAESLVALSESLDAIVIDTAGIVRAAGMSARAGASARHPFLATLATDGSGPVGMRPLFVADAVRATGLACDPDGTAYVVGRRVAAGPDAPERGFAAVVPAPPSSEPAVTLLDRVPLTVAATGDGHAWIAGEEFRGAESSTGVDRNEGPPRRTAFIARLAGLDRAIDRVRPIAGAAMARATGLGLDPDGRPVVAGIDRADADGGARLLAAAAQGGLVAVRPVPEGSIAPAAAGCPGTIRFDNSAGTGLWATATNWNTDVLPGAADDVCIPAGAAVTLNSVSPSIGSLFVESGASLSVTTTLTIASASQVSGTLTLSSGGIAGNFDLVLNGAFTWTGGSLSGAGTTEANGGMALGGANVKDLVSSRVLNTHGTVTWTGTGSLRLGTGGTIHNLGTWDARSDAQMTNSLGGTTLFDNPAGSTFKKTLGNGTTALDVPWSGNGAVSIESGTVSFNSGGSSDGTFTGLAAGTLRFGGGSFTLGTASTVNVPNASVASGTLTVNGAWTTTTSGSSSNGTTWTFNPAATLNAIGPALSIAGTVVLNSGEAVNVATLTVSSGSRQGTDTLSVSGTFAWSGGALNSAATTNANGPLAISAAQVKDMTGGHVLSTKGTTTWSGTGSIRLGGGSQVRNTGAWEAQSDASMVDTLAGGGSFDNQAAGTFTKKAGAGTTSLSLPVTNTGAIAVETGAISLAGGGSGPGSYTGLAGATLRFDGGSFTLDATATLNVPNVVVAGSATLSALGSFTASSSTTFSAGTTTFEPVANLVSLGALTVGGGTLDLRSGEAINVPTATFSAGATRGTDVITVSGLTTWSGGSIGGAAVFNANGGMAISAAQVKDLVDGRTLNTSGTVTWTGTGAIRTRASSVRNAGLWQAQSDAQFTDSLGAGGVFDNLAGATFAKTAGAGATDFSLPLLNHGTLDIQSGTVRISEGGNSTVSITGSAGTTFQVSNSAFSFDSGSSLQVPNVEVSSGGALEVHGSYAAAASTSLVSGALTFFPEATVTSVGTALSVGGTLDLRSGETINVTTLAVSSGTLKGSDTVNVSGAMSWSGGHLTESGILNANGGGTISGASVKDLSGGRVLNTSGAFTWTGTGPIRMGTGGAIRNSGTWSAQSDTQINNLLGGPGLFDNTAGGTFQRSAGAGTLGLLVDVTNAGVVRAQSGTLQFSTSYTQTAGSLSLEGGAVLASVPLQIQGGSLAGSGTVTGNVSLNGHLAPGLSPGSLTITGTLTDTAASSFDVEIGGLTPATEHDRAVLNSAPTIAGTLNVTLINGFVPADLDTWTILTFPSATGTFATVNTPALPGGLVWQIFYNPASVTLRVISDLDGDGVSNLLDCAPADASAWSVPAEVIGVALGTNNQTVSWTSQAAQAGPGTIYDLMRGLISQLPTGGKPAETCLAPDSGSTQFVDATTPAVGAGYYYLVRGSNVCGVGTYGTTSGGAPRNTAVCP